MQVGTEGIARILICVAVVAGLIAELTGGAVVMAVLSPARDSGVNGWLQDYLPFVSEDSGDG